MDIAAIKELGLAEWFMANKLEDKFINLKRAEDLSTVYHGEFKGGVEGLSYWATPPAGFKHKADVLLGIIGLEHGLVLAASKTDCKWTYNPIRAIGGSVDHVIEEYGYEFNHVYDEHEVHDLITVVV